LTHPSPFLKQIAICFVVAFGLRFVSGREQERLLITQILIKMLLILPLFAKNAKITLDINLSCCCIFGRKEAEGE
jgi:hypothetical protein